MKREMLISFLPPVLLSLAARLAVLAIAVFGRETFATIGVCREWAMVLALFLGAPVFIGFAGVRLWKARAKLAGTGVLFASAAVSVAILSMNFGEAYGRLFWRKAGYGAVAAQRPQDLVIVFDWGAGPGPILFSGYKQYLVIARGGAVQTIEAFAGHRIGSWGGERQDVDSFLSAAWDEKDRARRFRQGKFDACHMRIVHLMGHYYYAVDAC